MSIQINQGALNALGNQVATQAEQAFNQGLRAARGQPLSQAVQTVARAIQSANVQPDLEGIRSKLAELGWR